MGIVQSGLGSSVSSNGFALWSSTNSLEDAVENSPIIHTAAVKLEDRKDSHGRSVTRRKIRFKVCEGRHTQIPR